MPENSRRTFLKQAGVVVGAAVVVPEVAAAPADAAPTGPAHDGPFLAWVKDPEAGDISVLVGQTEVVHRDRALARQLAQIAARAPSS
jgi:hypothetical protein